MAEWRVRPLSEMTENLDSRRVPIKEADRRPGPYPYYGASGIVDYVDDFLFDGLHLLIAEDGENLRTRKLPIAFLADGRFWVNNHAHIVRGNNEADTRYLLYALLTADVTSYLSGSTMPKLTQGNLNRIPILAPCKREQEAIASVLGALDDKIELNRRMNETLEATARAIFKDWFVDFGPTRAKMEGRAPYLAEDIWSLFPDRLDDDGKPEGWIETTVGTEFNLTMGQSPPGETYNETGDGLPFFQGRTDFGFRYPVRRKFCSAPTRIARPDDTLVSVRAPVGDLNMAWEECCIGRGVAAVRHKRGGRGYTQYSMQFLQPAIARFEDSGSVFGAINKVQFERLRVISPPPELMDQFEATVQGMDDRIRSNTSETETLATTRDFLLPKLMSGEVRVKDAEKLVGEAT